MHKFTPPPLSIMTTILHKQKRNIKRSAKLEILICLCLPCLGIWMLSAPQAKSGG